MKNRQRMILLTAGLLLFAGPLLADDEAERAQNAAEALTELVMQRDNDIPRELLDHAEAIAVIPKVVKGAFVVGGKYGKGLITKRTDRGWTAPSFIELSGLSVGLQIGGSATDVVLVFTDRNGVEALLEGKVKLGADVSVAAGPVGRTAEASTDIKLDSAIYSYSRSKGLFAGLALDGAVLSIDDSANENVYGPNVSGTDILLRDKVSPTPEVQPFMRAVEEHLPFKADKKPVI